MNENEIACVNHFINTNNFHESIRVKIIEFKLSLLIEELEKYKMTIRDFEILCNKAGFDYAAFEMFYQLYLDIKHSPSFI